ncbi:MAG TPA: hypothetical protein VLH08_11665 [Acidobacteriota bacterium]|nr:hypothetical protein [Acidobacteriota bacterium]
MITEKLRIVIIGLSITSSWGNGHATTYRALVRALSRHGHDTTFLKRDVPWYAANRDLPNPPYCHTFLYSTLKELHEHYAQAVQDADLVLLGSYVPDGAQIGEWICDTAAGVKAFYDIDTPVTLSRLESDGIDYLSRDLIPEFDLYLSFSGGPILKTLELKYGAKRAEAFLLFS